MNKDESLKESLQKLLNWQREDWTEIHASDWFNKPSFKAIEQQPRSSSGDSMLLKVNEIITKFNLHEQRLKALEKKILEEQSERLIAAVEQAEATLTEAFEFFTVRTGEVKK